VQVYKHSIGAACNLVWPSDRLIVQVLDNSRSKHKGLLLSLIVNWNVNQTQTPTNYVENPRRKKSRRKEREVPLNPRNYKGFSMLYYRINSLGYHLLSVLLKDKVYLY